MKKNIILIFTAITTLISCYSDKGNYDYTKLPEIVIEGVKSDYGDKRLLEDYIEINPIVKFGDDTNEGSFSYIWTIVQGGELKRIAETKNLKYLLTQNGTISFRLEVIHNGTKLKNWASASCKVSSETEQGWYVLKETAQGNTDMDLHLTPDGGDYSIKRDVLKGLLGNSLEGVPVGMNYSEYYSFQGDDIQTPRSVMISSEEDMTVLDVVNLSVLARFDDLFYEPMPTKGQRKIKSIYTSEETTGIIYGQGRLKSMLFPKSPQFTIDHNGDYNFDSKATTNQRTSNILLYDKITSSFKTTSARSSDIYNIPEKVNALSLNNFDSEMLFMTRTERPKVSSYIMLRKKINPDSLLLCQIVLAPLQNPYGLRMTKIDTLLTSQGLLSKGKCFAANCDGGYIYFSIGGRLHKYDIKEAIPQNRETLDIIDFGNEEITWVKHIHKFSLTQNFKLDFNKKFLVVATTLNGKYKLRLYNTSKNGDLTSTEPFEIYEGDGAVRDARFIFKGNPTTNYVYY